MTEPTKEGRRVAFQTFGCRSNYADTVDLQAALVERGIVPCDFESEAETYVINTCTVTDNADREAYRLIRRLRKERPGAKIVVTGCMAEVSNSELESMEEVDAVVGPGRKTDVLRAILGETPEKGVSKNGVRHLYGNSAQDLQTNTQTEAVNPVKVSDPVLRRDPIGRRTKKALPERKSISLEGPMSEQITGPGDQIGEVTNRSRFHLRIQEGCENSCTFCIIPFSRGRLSSRPFEDVLADLRRLSAVGYKEVVLTGTHIGGYGEDRGLSLYHLLEQIEAVEGAPRIRLSSIDPNDLTNNIIELMAKSSVLCHYLHICVQAFSDSTLKRMNRRYRMQDVVEKVSRVKELMPACTIGSDVIAGFPGESRQEVDQAMETFLSLPFSYLHVFPYSERAGTAAVRLDGTVESAERKRRAARWRSLGEQKRLEFLKTLVGKRLEIVIENRSETFAQGQIRSVYGTSREFAQAEIIFADETRHRDQTEKFVVGQLVHAVGRRVDSAQRKIVCEL